MKINNRNKYYNYYNKITQNFHENIWEFLTIDNIRNADYYAHEFNCSHFVPRPDEYKEVLKGIIPIPPRSNWLLKKDNFISSNNFETKKEYLNSNLISILIRLNEVIKNKNIAVELSGGLDTSIIIGILKSFDIDPLLIGLKSDRYEFRTERIIQENFSKNNKNSLLIDHEKFLPFSNLFGTPVHQLPSATSLFYSGEDEIAQKCKKENINIVFNGMGLDIIFCENTNLINQDSLHHSWCPWMLDNDWFNEYIYKKFNIKYVSAAASKLIIESVYYLRKEQLEDNEKKWARQTFSKFLPPELVNFRYKADHIGNFINGVQNSENDISELFKFTYELVHLKEFSPLSIKILLENIQKNDDKQIKMIMARVSYANWLFGLMKSGIIKV